MVLKAMQYEYENGWYESLIVVNSERKGKLSAEQQKQTNLQTTLTYLPWDEI